MREIKFRAYSKNEKEMFNSEYLKGAGDGLARMATQVLGQLVPGGLLLNLDDKDLIIMQYTGLKDKNGREIYEGDILKCKCAKRNLNIPFDPDFREETFYRNSVVEWWESHCNLGFRLRDGKGKTLMIKPSSLMKMEVEIIGNIYGNPELINGVSA